MEDDLSNSVEKNDLPILTEEDDWLNLKPGDKAILRGSVGGDHFRGSTSLLVYFENWTAQCADIIDEDGLMRYLHNHQKVDALVTVTEDGLITTSEDITIRE